MNASGSHIKVYVVLLCALLVNFALWLPTHHKLPEWANVPPPPTKLGAAAGFLGDEELAYRSLAITLQSFGNTTGQIMALKDYNYNNLGKWFFLEDSLNPHSEYVPFLAGNYFGATQDPSELRPLIDYLRVVGQRPEGEKWRWLGMAVFLARHRMNDMQLALSLSEDLAKTYRPGMPAWPLQMKAFVASSMGEKDLAYGMMLEMINTEAKTMDPVEVNYMIDYICHTILSPVESAKDPLCQKHD